MSRSIPSVAVRGASLTLWIAAVLSGISCRDDQSLGPTDPSTTADAGPALAGAATARLSFYQVSLGDGHTCGVTTDNRVYCWGYNQSGQIGDGTTINRLTPVPVATTLRFREVSAGGDNTCGLTTEYRAYCWGDNSLGELGDGTTIDRFTPAAVAGGRQFRQVGPGTYSAHTCGVGYTDNRAYCWGGNFAGELGDGTTINRLTPVPVATTLRFRQVSEGGAHTCGVTTDNRAFCWGRNSEGQIGDRSQVGGRLRPTLVADGYRFLQVDAGDFHTCGVTTGKRAYCWGDGRHVELGNGRAYLSFWPRPVAGGLSFERVSAGFDHTCGETTLNRAYCWGTNNVGQLGDGTTHQRLTPVAVAGGLFFSQVSAGGEHACGRTDAAVAYCWGGNIVGSLGDGTTTNRLRPVPVAGPM